MLCYAMSYRIDVSWIKVVLAITIAIVIATIFNYEQMETYNLTCVYVKPAFTLRRGKCMTCHVSFAIMR